MIVSFFFLFYGKRVYEIKRVKKREKRNEKQQNMQ